MIGNLIADDIVLRTPCQAGGTVDMLKPARATKQVASQLVDTHP